MKDLSEMMKQAEGLKARMQALQERVAAIEVEGVAGGGMVKVRLNGKGFAKSASIDKALMKPEESEIVEDLVVAAINDAKARLEAQAAEEMKAITAGLPLPPGFKLPF